jgi:UDP-2,3-diacylglucosamine hydrolase
MFDYWFEYKYVVPKGFVRFLGKLAELSDQGIEIHLFTGNHDIWMFNYLPEEIGAIIHRNILTVDLLGKRFFLGHGDEVDCRNRMFRLLRAFFRNRFCQRLYAGIHPRWTFGFALDWSLSSRENGLTKEVAPEETSGYLVAFAREYLKTHPDIHFFIFGHHHIMLDLTLSRTSRLLIAGDWMRLFSYIEWDGQTLSLLQFSEE